jgi:glycosyltransferase involved in cell wall biosynthesis
MHILFLAQICPYPPTSGGAIKSWNILRHLASKHEVRLLTFTRKESENESIDYLRNLCASVEACRITREGLDAGFAARSVLGGKSFIISRDHRPEMQALIRRNLELPTNLIYVDHLQMFQYVQNPPPCAVLLDEHNVEWQIIRRMTRTGVSIPQRLFAVQEWPKLRRYELDACGKADKVLTVTESDKRMLGENGIGVNKLSVIPIGVDTEYFQPVSLIPTSRRILTFGTMSWPPNADSVIYFADSIYPLVKKRAPDVRFIIAGANPPQRIRNLAAQDPSIEVTGFVEDIRDLAPDTAAFVVPLRAGSGMRVKILDAMAMGLPVVTTSIGCEGIDLQHGKHALVTDKPEDFARAVIRLMDNPDERFALASAGRRLVEDRYSWPPILSRLDVVIEELMGDERHVGFPEPP